MSETTNSTPITGLPELTGRIKVNDVMLISKTINGEYNSRKFSYATLTSNISTDILPLVPKEQFPLYESSLPLESDMQTKAYTANSVTKFYNDTQEKITNLDNIKLDKTTTQNQTVESKVNFKKQIQCPTSTGANVRDVVNVEYLNNFTVRHPPYIIEFWSNPDGIGWYKLYSNGFLEQGGYGDNVIPLYKEFKDKNYTLQITGSASLEDKTEKTIDLKPAGNYCYWEAKGMAKGY